jgi:putative Mn2+ efflux pump MntP
MPEAARLLLNVTMAALLVVAVALGLNNFGAAIAIGVSGVDRRTEIKVATVFGLCDVVMPAAGMLIGTGLAGPLGSAARWAGAGVLFVTAAWGLVEALRGSDEAPRSPPPARPRRPSQAAHPPPGPRPAAAARTPGPTTR